MYRVMHRLMMNHTMMPVMYRTMVHGMMNLCGCKAA
jgi:hypothetical protein